MGTDKGYTHQEFLDILRRHPLNFELITREIYYAPNQGARELYLTCLSIMPPLMQEKILNLLNDSGFRKDPFFKQMKSSQKEDDKISPF